MPKELGDIVFADLLPGSIKDDPVVKAAAEALDAELRAVTDLVPQALLFSRIDELEEPVLSLLAHQLHVDFWESGWSLEVKREVLKGSTQWHKYKGTRFAVESLLQAMGYDAGVQEAVEYGGDPYRFRVSVSGRMAGVEDYAGVMQAVEASKNTRSHLDAIVVTDVCDAAPKAAGVASVVSDLQGIPLMDVIADQTTPHVCGVGVIGLEIRGVPPTDTVAVDPTGFFAAGAACIHQEIRGE